MSHADTPGNVSVEAREGVLLIGLDRADKLNGITPEMLEMLSHAYTRLEDDQSLRVGLLFAHGRHFTAGLDLPRFAGTLTDRATLHTSGRIDPFDQRQPHRSKPVVAAVQGITFTAGLEMALAADIVISASGARFAQLEPKRGLMAVGGAVYRFIDRGGWGNAMRWLLTGDEFNAEEALRIGIVQEVVPDDQTFARALALAQAIATRAPLAVQETRRAARLYASQGEAAIISQQDSIQARLAATEDFAEGVQSFKDKRDAQFSGK